MREAVPETRTVTFATADCGCEVLTVCRLSRNLRADLLERAFANLVRNAVRYASENVTITIAALIEKSMSSWR